MDQNDTNTRDSSTNNSKLFVAFIWITSLALTGFIAFSTGKNSASNKINNNINPTPVVLGSTVVPTQTVNDASVDTSAICEKSGFSQKWEYLVSYTIKDGDSLALIAEREMGDAARIDEIGSLNSGTAQLVVGSVVYLPPKLIKKSSGNIKEVNGMLVAKNNANWHISFGGGSSGPGIMIPAYWFSDVQNRNDLKAGTCISVLFDDGFKVFSASTQ